MPANCHVHGSKSCNSPASLDSPVDNKLLMKTWLHRCQTTHKACSSSSNAFLPTRLIDVEAFPGSSDVRLVDSIPLKIACDRRRISYPEYLALSHCWGPEEKRPIITTLKSLSTRQDRIVAKDLSKTFLDAVIVTRQLGERYLWIDSLCILQHDGDDWAREAARMADVYGNALCTLSALSSEDGTQGCRMIDDLRKSTGNSFVDLQFERTIHGFMRMYRQPPTPWNTEYGEEPTVKGRSPVQNPLRYRAWTLQEAELSRRTIFFAERQILWRCRELRGTAELPWTQQLPYESYKQEPWPLCDGLQDDQTEGNFADTRMRWYKLVEDYSLRDLSYDSDKLTALAGLAKDYRKIFAGAEYVAGMWGPHMPRMPLYRLEEFPNMRNNRRYQLHSGKAAIRAHCAATLLWHSMDSKARRYKDYVAPTWSWASIKGRITYDSQRIEPHGNSFDRMGVREELSDCDFGGLQWGPMFAQPANGDKYGTVKTGAHLVLSGALLAQCTVPSKPFSGFPAKDQGRKTRQDSLISQLMKNIRVPPQEQEETVMEGETLTVQGRTVGVFLRDSADDGQFPHADIFCLRVRGEPFFSLRHHDFKSQQETVDMDMVMGIVLVRIQDHKLGETYQRIGLARWVSAAIFKHSHPVGIKLV